MLTGNSAAFTFLVNAETEHNEYVAARPFRVNAGAVHAYACLPGDRTCYLEELAPGAKILIADQQGKTFTSIVGRVKVEKRPMLLIKAEAGEKAGSVFLQNAETIHLVKPDGSTASVVALAPGDRVLCRVDEAGRHFGMRIREEIFE
jgi:3-dehydroquinate synthase II